MTRFQAIRAKSVFRPTPEGATMSDLFSILFHRTAATVYAIYAGWSVVSILTGIPTLATAQGREWQIAFSLLVLIFIVPACWGATFFPKAARLELYASAAFVSLMLIYLGFVFINAVGGGGSWAGMVLVLSVIALPACRAAVIFWLLLKQAEELK